MSFIRSSKYRNVSGRELKTEQGYSGMRISNNPWNSPLCAVNPKYVAVIIESGGGGAFHVIPLEQTGCLDADYPKVCGHEASVLDIAWCPHSDNLIASASEDCSVKLWEIPEGGLRNDLEKSLVDLRGHQRAVGIIQWHPTAANILLSAGKDNKVLIWNMETREIITEIGVPAFPLCASWNLIGNKVVTSCTDNKVRILDPRTGSIIKACNAHEGSKPVQVKYLQDDYIFTTGFSRMRVRQYAMWDKDMNRLMIEELDASNGVLFPCYDPDTNMVYLVGKGDSVIRYYEITKEDPYAHYITTFQSATPQKGFGFMPKRGVNVNNCEIARIYKLKRNQCDVISFAMPRSSDLFQDDLYPDTASDKPALQADEWISGKDSMPLTISMRDFYKTDDKAGQSKKKESVSTNKEEEGSESSPASGSRAECMEQLLAEVKSLRDAMTKLELRVESVEDKLA